VPVYVLSDRNPLPPVSGHLMNKLYFGDNLDILREHIASESVDLIYLGSAPFNSKRDYSVLFKTPKGHESDAQITAFEDSWHWGEQAEREFNELLHAPNTDVAEMMLALRKFLKENDMMAYLTMMANRLSYLILLTLFIMAGCDRTMPTGFWESFQGYALQKNVSDQGPWGGTHAMYWKDSHVDTFQPQQVIKFASQNGWTFLDSSKVSSEDVRKWNVAGTAIFPLSEEGLDTSVSNDFACKHFPRWIEGDITLLRFKTNWITVTPGTGKDNPSYGYVILNHEHNQMSVYHMWGE